MSTINPNVSIERPACQGGRFREMEPGRFAIQCNCGPPCRFCRIYWFKQYSGTPRPPNLYEPAKHGVTYQDIDRLINPPLRRSERKH